MLNAQLSGYFWDLAPYLKDTSNLSKMSEEAVRNATVNGSLYGIPRERVLARYGMIFRKDWLDNLGLNEPKQPGISIPLPKHSRKMTPIRTDRKIPLASRKTVRWNCLNLTVYNGG